METFNESEHLDKNLLEENNSMSTGRPKGRDIRRSQISVEQIEFGS